MRVVKCLCLLGLLAAGPLLAADEIRIGAIFSVTGPAANLGAPEARSAEMLAERINAEGGLLGKRIKLIVKDSAGSPEKAVSFCKQLIEEENVLAIIGPSTSGETLQIKAICEEAGMILISCAAAETIVNPVARHVFKTPQKDSQAATWIFKTMVQLGLHKVGVVVDNTGFGQAGRAQLEALAPTHGIQIVAAEVYDKGATDLTDILTKLKGAGVEAVINWSIVPAQSIVARNLRQLGLKIPLFQSHGFGNLKYVEMAGPAAEGILFPGGQLLVADVLPEGHPQKALLLDYRKAYETRFKEDASAFGGYAWDALAIVAAAVRKAESTDRAKVRDAIEGLKGFVGASGVFNFSPTDHNGLGLDAFEMLTVKDGRFVIYQAPKPAPQAPAAKP